MKNFPRKSFIVFSLALAITAIFILWLSWADKALTEREFEITSDRIPSAFDGFRITQISDLHNASFGEDNKILIEKIKDTSPDIIVVTGDVIDSRHTDIPVAEAFLEKAVTVAPVFFITGNHESRIADYPAFEEKIKKLGVTVLDNSKTELKRNGEKINLCGVSDPAFRADYLFGEEGAVVARYIDELYEKDNFNILLSHRPEFFGLYAEYSFDLIFSGHAHGGQFRFPIVGGLIAPGQGLFPEFDSGLYKKENTSMIVSRGLGNSVIPLRFCNRPEIITVTLKSH